MKIIWHIKQLLPLSYWTTYSDDSGQRYLSIWRMWFGHVFDLSTIKVR